MNHNDQEWNQGSDPLNYQELLQITMVAEAYTGNLPFEAIHQFAARFHFHCIKRIFFEDPEKFQQLKTQYGVDTELHQHEAHEMTELLVNKIDEFFGYDSGGDLQNPDPKQELDLPDAKYFREQGLL